MPYTPQKPRLPETTEELRARIPGWGADLDPRDRPAVPRLQHSDTASEDGVPDRQEERSPRERSIEHADLTPVFGTAQPLRGLSGTIRRWSYRRFSEARAAHWLLLVAADRVDVVENRIDALRHGRPDDLVAETGIKGELTGHGLSSRMGRRRSDVKHQWMDPLVVGAPWVAGGVAALAVVRRVRRG